MAGFRKPPGVRGGLRDQCYTLAALAAGAAPGYSVRPAGGCLAAMPRQLSAIEIAEGALLADIAVILQLFAMYLPVFDTFIRLLIPIVFAVLVLRRRLYAAVLCLCVTCFIVSALSGLALLVPMLLSCGAGLYLGQTMKRRLPHAIVVLLGMTSGALAVCGVLVAVCSAAA